MWAHSAVEIDKMRLELAKTAGSADALVDLDHLVQAKSRQVDPSRGRQVVDHVTPFLAASPQERARWCYDATDAQTDAMRVGLLEYLGDSVASPGRPGVWLDAVKASKAFESDEIEAAVAVARAQAAAKIRARKSGSTPSASTPPVRE